MKNHNRFTRCFSVRKGRYLLFLFVLVAAAATVVVFNRQTVPAAEPKMRSPVTSSHVPVVAPQGSKREIVSNGDEVQEQKEQSFVAQVEAAPVVRKSEVSKKPQSIAPHAPQPPKAKEPLRDPDARVALSLVGVDSDAEEYWVSAINDPNLSAHERQDLIEDLNEVGIVDPKHPTLDDVPVIINRMQMIEALAPESMDPVNWDAFREAYNDLSKMLADAKASYE